MQGNDRMPVSMTSFVFKRIVPWVVLFAAIYYVFSMGRTYMSQVGTEEPPNPLVTTQTTTPAAKPKSIGTVKVLSEYLNFRTQPSTSSGAIITRLRKGATLAVLEKIKNWYKVQNAQGTTGYVFSDRTYVQFTAKKK